MVHIHKIDPSFLRLGSKLVHTPELLNTTFSKLHYQNDHHYQIIFSMTKQIAHDQIYSNLVIKNTRWQSWFLMQWSHFSICLCPSFHPSINNEEEPFYLTVFHKKNAKLNHFLRTRMGFFDKKSSISHVPVTVLKSQSLCCSHWHMGGTHVVFSFLYIIHHFKWFG